MLAGLLESHLSKTPGMYLVSLLPIELRATTVAETIWPESALTGV